MDMSIYIDTPIADKAAMKDFLLANSQSHSQVAVTMEQLGLSVLAYPLTDVTVEWQWLSDHAQVHSNEFSQLGLVGLPDLEDVDFSDAQQYRDWQELHAAVHQAVNQALGIVS